MSPKTLPPLHFTRRVVESDEGGPEIALNKFLILWFIYAISMDHNFGNLHIICHKPQTWPKEGGNEGRQTD